MDDEVDFDDDVEEKNFDGYDGDGEKYFNSIDDDNYECNPRTKHWSWYQ